MYESGTPLSTARGHGSTPERPERAFRSPDRFANYLRRRVRKNLPVPVDIEREFQGPPAAPGRAPIGSTIGWPGRDTFDVLTFTRNRNDEYGNITVMRYAPNHDVVDMRTLRFRQDDFRTLVRLARQRGFAVNVVSTPTGLTA